MKTIENLKELNDLLQLHSASERECILRVYDNKSDILLQTVVCKHPVVFIRGIQEFCQSANLPVSDVSVQLIGFISESSLLYEIEAIVELSPYIYFKKADDVNVETSKN